MLRFPARLLAPLLLAGCAASAQSAPTTAPSAVTYTLGGTLYAKVYKDPSTLAAGLSHDHVIKATGWTGTATWDPANPAACKFDITLPVTGLEPDDPTLRAKAGLSGTLDDGQRADVKSNLLGDDQLDATRFPNITYTSSACAANGNATNVTGTLGIHGVGKPITVPVNITADGATFSAKGGFSITHRDFGMTPYSALLGQLKNQDKIDIVIQVTGTKR
jgi:polyisoprenoid-binding protein YceI